MGKGARKRINKEQKLQKEKDDSKSLVKNFFLHNTGKTFAIITGIVLLLTALGVILQVFDFFDLKPHPSQVKTVNNYYVNGDQYIVSNQPELMHPDMPSHDYEVAQQYLGQLNYSKALEYLEKALREQIEINGPNHSDTAKIYNSLGAICYNIARYNDALDYYNHAYATWRSDLDNDNRVMLSIYYNNVAIVYIAKYDYKKSLEYLHISMELKQQFFGDQSPFVATTYNNLGTVYRECHEYEEAMKWFSKALDIYGSSIEKSYYEEAAVYNNIAMVYQAQGRYEEALEILRETLEAQESTIGKVHPTTANTQNNIGAIYTWQGDYTTALEFFKEALQTREKLLGKEHLVTAESYNNIATVYKDQCNYNEALELYQRALVIKESVLGTHPSTAGTYGSIAVIYSEQGRYDDALELFQKALAIYEENQGKESLDIALVSHNMAITYLESGNNEEAFESAKVAYIIFRKMLGDDHPYTVSAKNSFESIIMAIVIYNSTAS